MRNIHTCRLVFLLILSLINQPTVEAQSNTVIDSLKQLLSTAPDTQQVHLLNQMLWAKLYNAPEEALRYGNQAMAKARDIDFRRGIANTYLRLGVVYDVTGKYDSALTHYQRAIDMGVEENEPKIYGGAYNNIGLVYWNLGDLEQAVTYYLLAAKVFDELDSDKGLGNTYNNIGLIYQDMDQPDEALKYFELAMQHRKKAGDEHGIGATLGNMALSYSSKNDYKKALEFHNREISKKQKINDLNGLSIAYNNKAINFDNLDDKDSALINFRQSLQLKIQLNDAFGESSTRINMGALFLSNGLIDSAFTYLGKAEEIAENIGSKKLQYKVYKDLAQAHSYKGNFDKAYTYAMKYATYRDSVLDEEKTRQLLEITNKYETDKSLRELALLRAENKVKDLELKKQKQAANIKLLGLFSILVICIAVFIIWYFRSKAKRKIDMQAIQNKHRAERFMAVIDAQEMERKRIARELHDSLGQLLSTARINMSGLQDLATMTGGDEANMYEVSLKLIDDACAEVRTISHNMMPGTLVDLGLVAALKDLAEKISRSGLLEVKIRTHGKLDKLKESVEISLYRVMQEILNNVISHAKARQVTVDIERTDDKLNIKVRDDGIGMTESTAKKSAGIGWKNIFSRIEMVNGQIAIHPASAGGTEVAIALAV